MKITQKLICICIIIGLCFVYSGCGDDDSSEFDRDAVRAGKTYIKGTAADGEPIIGSVFIQGSQSEEKTVVAQIGPEGQFEVNISDLSPPYLLYARGQVGSKPVKYYAMTNSTDRINCTAYSHAALQMALNGEEPETYFETNPIAQPASFSDTSDIVREAVQTLLTSLNGTNSSFDAFSGYFVATINDNTGFDKLLQISQVETTSSELFVNGKTVDSPLLYSIQYQPQSSPNTPVDLATQLSELSTKSDGLIVDLTILQTSDIHNHASGYGPFADYTPMDTSDQDIVRGGFARIASKVKEIKIHQLLMNTPVLLVDSGDFTMGTMYDLAAASPIPFIYFQALGYDAITLGNHEFDWSPKGLAMLIQNGIQNELMPFQVPIVASNTIIPTDNELNNFKNTAILDSLVKELPNGLKVGILGFLGRNADSYAPAAPPVTFDHDTASLQSKVDKLKNDYHCDIILVLSHGGVDKTGTGDDNDLANTVDGIDIIASGHAHTAAHQPFTRGPNNTLIFSPGSYGEYLSRLDIRYNLNKKCIVDYRFELVEMNDTVEGSKEMDDTIKLVNSTLSASLQAALGSKVGDKVAYTDIEVAFSEEAAGPSGIGNLCTDAFRGIANALAPADPHGTTPYMLSFIANGTLRDCIKPGKNGIITFSDIFNVLPLGMSPKGGMPGYPLISTYLNAYDIRALCEISVAVMIGTGLPESSFPPLPSSFYFHFSGVNYEYDPSASMGQRVKVVKLYSPADPMCSGVPILTLSSDQVPDSIWDANSKKLYRAAVDLYLLQMFYSLSLPDSEYKSLSALFPNFKDANGNPLPSGLIFVDYDTFCSAYAIDADPSQAGVQELMAWTALFKFIQAWQAIPTIEQRDGLPVLPAMSPYNTSVIPLMPRLKAIQ
ncbi:metallophosphoesterase [Candidatus Magnetomorum sp. HK-1]|nr:metallophosphoesterase [Candidatus Magnetomorum sp. HK-1]